MCVCVCTGSGSLEMEVSFAGNLDKVFEVGDRYCRQVDNILDTYAQSFHECVAAKLHVNIYLPQL